MSGKIRYSTLLILFIALFVFDHLHARKKITESQVRLKQGSEVGVVQKRTYTKRLRLEYVPLMLGTITNDPFINNYLYGFSLIGHLNDYFGIELSYILAKSSENDLNRVLQNDYGKTVVAGKTSSMYSANILWTPMYGKFSLFNKFVIFLDTYFTVGFGSTKTHLATAATINVGIGQRYFFTKWMAIKLDVRNYMHKETRGKSEIYKKNLVFIAGVSFLFPNRDDKGL